MAQDNSEKGSDMVGVLIADNDKNSRVYLNTALAKAGGYRVWTAATCAEAMNVLSEITNPEDMTIAVFDLGDEKLEGTLLLQKICSDPKFFLVDILLNSDKFENSDMFMLKEFGVTYSLSKGATTGEFLSKIKEIRKDQLVKIPAKKKLRELELALRNGAADDFKKLADSPDVMEIIEKDKDAAHYKAEILIANNEVNASINFLSNHLRSAESGSGETFKTLGTFGKALCLGGKFEDAHLVFQKLANKSPKNLAHKVGCGEAMLGKGDVEGAKSQFSQVLDADPSNADAKIGKGKAHLALGETDEAMNIFQSMQGSIESYSLASYFNNAAIALVKSNKASEAIEMYENAVKFFDKYKPNIYFNMGLAYLKCGNADKAAKCFDNVLKSGAPDFIAKKIILAEYKEKGKDFIQKKYASNVNDKSLENTSIEKEESSKKDNDAA